MSKHQEQEGRVRTCPEDHIDCRLDPCTELCMQHAARDLGLPDPETKQAEDKVKHLRARANQAEENFPRIAAGEKQEEDNQQ